MNLKFTPTANGTSHPGIMDFTNDPPTLFCYCKNEIAEIILKALTPKPKREAKTFQKPTIEEIQEYCNQRNNGIDAEKFWHSYESKNWMIGKVKMKSWQSAIVTWEKNPMNDKKTVAPAVIGRQSIETVTKNAANW